MARRRHIIDLGRMQHGEFGVTANFACEVEVRSRRHALDRDEVDQVGIFGDSASVDVDEIDQTLRLEEAQDLQPRRWIEAASDPFVDPGSDADDELGANPPTNRAQN